MPKKRGKLSLEEEAFIRESVAAGMSMEDIATQLNRTIQPVARFCADNNLTYAGMSEELFDDTILRAKLEEKPYYQEIKQQFTERELEYFIVTWVKMIKQFREDILYSEELQVKQWITLEIMGNKVMRDRKRAQEQIDRLDVMLVHEYALPEEHRDATLIANLETELAAIRNAQSSYTNEHSKILDKIERIQNQLKAARADRIKKVEDSKSSWAGLMTALENEQLRRKVGEDIVVHKLAKDAAVERLSRYHTYDNGEIDQPLLNADTLLEEDE